jgi:hypothetical protein
MDEIIKKAVEFYQCPGCVGGHNIECYQKGDNEACDKHVAGTIISNIGPVFLGMPTGFNRLGAYRQMKMCIFRELKDGWGYDQFNIPAWKYRDEHGNVLVRGICPRINYPWVHIFLTDCMAEINCIEITAKDISEMD